MGENEYLFQLISAGRLREAREEAAARALHARRPPAARTVRVISVPRAAGAAAAGAAAVAFAIAARIVENAGTKLMNARRRATSEG